jgi:hypothetical protein
MPLETFTVQPRPAPAPAPAFSQELTAGTLISRTLSVWWKNMFRFAGVTLVLFVPMILVALGLGVGAAVTAGRGPAGSGPPVAMIVTIVAIAVPLLGIALVAQMGALTYGAVQHLAGRPVRFGVMLSVGFGRLLPLIGGAIIAGVLTFLGAIALVIPGIIIGCALATTMPVVVTERLGPIAAIRRSWELTRGYRGTIFLAGLALSLISFLINVGGSLVGLIPILGQIVSLVLQILTVSLGTVMPAVAYHDLRARKEGTSTDELAKVFE